MVIDFLEAAGCQLNVSGIGLDEFDQVPVTGFLIIICIGFPGKIPELKCVRGGKADRKAGYEEGLYKFPFHCL
jgi:hypothetical protein